MEKVEINFSEVYGNIFNLSESRCEDSEENIAFEKIRSCFRTN